LLAVNLFLRGSRALAPLSDTLNLREVGLLHSGVRIVYEPLRPLEISAGPSPSTFFVRLRSSCRLCSGVEGMLSAMSLTYSPSRVAYLDRSDIRLSIYRTV